MNTHISRTVTAVLLTIGVILTMSSNVDAPVLGLLSGKGSTILQHDPPSLPTLTASHPPLHGAATEQNTAKRQLIMGILLILLGLGIYAFWSIRNHETPRSAKHIKRTTLVRTSSRWFWIG